VGYLAFCASNEHLCKLESEVFQKPHLRVAANRWLQFGHPGRAPRKTKENKGKKRLRWRWRSQEDKERRRQLKK